MKILQKIQTIDLQALAKSLLSSTLFLFAFAFAGLSFVSDDVILEKTYASIETVAEKSPKQLSIIETIVERVQAWCQWKWRMNDLLEQVNDYIQQVK